MADKSQTKNLDLHQNMTVEVLTLDNNLTFVGKVENYEAGTLTIRSSTGEELPPVLYNREVKLRCFQGADTVVLHGRICGSSQWIWKLYKLENKFLAEKRTFFRQQIKQDAMVMCVQRAGEDHPLKEEEWLDCKIKDVSAGGLLILSNAALYQVGDHLLVKDAKIVNEEPPFTFTCRVQRLVQNGNQTMYGCQFEALPPKEQDRLLRAIFTAQRKTLQTKNRSEV